MTKEMYKRLLKQTLVKMKRKMYSRKLKDIMNKLSFEEKEFLDSYISVLEERSNLYGKLSIMEKECQEVYNEE